MTEEQSTTDESESFLEVLRAKFPTLAQVPWFSAPVIGTALAVYIALRLAFATALNLSSSITVIAQAGVATVLLGTLTTLLPQVLALLPAVFVERFQFSRLMNVRGRRSLTAVIITTLITILIVPWPSALGAVVSIAISVVLTNRVRKRIWRSIDEELAESASRIPHERHHITVLEAMLDSFKVLRESYRIRANYLRRHGAELAINSDGQMREAVHEGYKADQTIRSVEDDIGEIARIIENKESALKALPTAPLYSQRERLEMSIRVSVGAIGGLAIYLLLLSLLAPIWLPEENIYITHVKGLSGYVLSEDQDWTSILTSHNQIVRVKTSSIEARENCGQAHQHEAPLFLLIHKHGGSPPARCLSGSGGILSVIGYG